MFWNKVIMNHTSTWNTNDPCFDCKRPSFGGLKHKNVDKQVPGMLYITFITYIYIRMLTWKHCKSYINLYTTEIFKSKIHASFSPPTGPGPWQPCDLFGFPHPGTLYFLGGDPAKAPGIFSWTLSKDSTAKMLLSSMKLGGCDSTMWFVEYQHLARGANETLRDGNLAPFRNHLAPFGRSRYEFVALFAMSYDYDLGTISLVGFFWWFPTFGWKTHDSKNCYHEHWGFHDRIWRAHFSTGWQLPTN